MRSLSCLALSIAALTSIACGGPAPEGGNAYVSEGALGTVDGVDNASAPFRLVTVAVDVKDQGCTVDDVRFGRCTLTRTPTQDVLGQSLDLCELQVENGGTYIWECDVGAEAVAGMDRQEFPWHCPTG